MARSRTSTVPLGPSSVVDRDPLGIIVVHPQAMAERSWPLTDGLTFGRNAGGASSHVAELDDAAVSREHARIEVRAGRALIRDLGSRNGTFVGGVRLVEPVWLEPQMVCRVGETIMITDAITGATFDATLPIPGTSPGIVELAARLELAAKDGGSVAIGGETGTGKERLAREVHRLSGRRGAFIAVNCAELSEHLVESLLFGHERGAFTGATQSRPGLFEAANHGTLFLDEMGELPLQSQSKLLRVLEEQELRPVGSVQTKRIDVRVVAATNRDLALEVQAGRFRRDLYARLAHWELTLPPVRARRQDLFHWMRLLWNLEGSSAMPSFSADAAERLFTYDWPDNLRGLHRLVRRLRSIRESHCGLRELAELMPDLTNTAPKRLPADGLQVATQSGLPKPPNISAASEETLGASAPGEGTDGVPSPEEFLRVFEGYGRNVRATARHFRRDRRQIYRWLERYGIKRTDAE